MSMLRFDPFRDIDRLSEQLFAAPAGTRRVPRFMPMDLFKSADHYVIVADLPGVDPGSIDVDVDNGTLTIRAERSPRSDDAVEWLASERLTGSFMRQIALGDGLDADGIGAHYENGVLSITIPVAEKAKRRKVEVVTSTSPETVIGTAQGSSEITQG